MPRSLSTPRLSPTKTPTPRSWRGTRRVMTVALSALAITALGLSTVSCTTDDPETSVSAGPSTPASTDNSSVTAEDAGLELRNGYVGAKAPDQDMTAVFGELVNTTDEDIHLTEAAGNIQGLFQYHEVTGGIMKQTDDGLTVPAQGSLALAPGEHHIMILQNHDDIAAGDAVTLTLTAEDGTTYELTDLPVRVQQSSHEDYAPDSSDSGDSGDSGDDEHAGH
ncbi:copper chaperone PCu(A)C [Corynebacterium glyciniphilum]|uniref:copper chaperone PCu(A)C n=1 Tax=Corynebacterium glyciniphilum TaxID=1404244 RepID=UPI0028CB2FF8|nr:copper chaperone PCu(A)C [Corynebacterium glyciniphilum]